MGAYAAPYEVLDCVPVPLMRRCRGRRRRLFGAEAAIGKGGSDRDWYYGCKLLLSVTAEGVVTGFTLAPADTEDRSGRVAVVLALRGVAPLMICRPDTTASDIGPTPVWLRAQCRICQCRIWLTTASHWLEDYGALVITPKNYRGEDAHRSKRQHSSWKQIARR